jgi:hypothetical protein
MLYSNNISAFFSLVGGLVSGLGTGDGVAIILGQIAIQTEDHVQQYLYCSQVYIYCLGATFGPGVGSLVIAFDVAIWGWHVNQGNSPGIVLTI